MKFKDCQLAKVDRNKLGELVVKFKVKSEDYELAEYLLLHDRCRDGEPLEVNIDTEANILVNKTDENFA